MRPAAAGPGQGPATIYACGITPYDATHIGHASTFTAWDLLFRAWLDAGRPVTYVQNVTDVDDPLLERAERDGEDWRELAARETQRFRGDMEALRLLPPAHLVGAVEAMPVIERFSERLADRGSLYDLEGDVYFARAADPEFGALSGPGTMPDLEPSEMAELFAERGGDPDRPGKKDPLDPIVWRAERPGEPAWDSAFGPGRPGWHVECAAIAAEYLGPAFDVQAGGFDLVFPHHEMSASHTRVAFAGRRGNVFARVYAHAGMVGLNGEKMSKSLGNLVFVSRLIEGGEDPMAVRLALLAHHYRTDWEWTEAGVAEARARLARWRSAVSAGAAGSAGSPGAGSPGAAVPAGAGSAGPGSAGAGSRAAAEAVLAGVRERLADDLDAPGAVAVVDRWADSVLTAGDGAGSGAGAARDADGSGAGAARDAGSLVRDTVDALLGVAL
jgi:L-cysteine:1D-myo-inositol 2-amino-2-deoxy-alpha-D-glucopyranoside ligase